MEPHWKRDPHKFILEYIHANSGVIDMFDELDIPAIEELERLGYIKGLEWIGSLNYGEYEVEPPPTIYFKAKLTKKGEGEIALITLEEL
jgi:hypothetical protein